MSEFDEIKSIIKNRFDLLEENIDLIQAEDLYREMTVLGELVLRMGAAQIPKGQSRATEDFMEAVLRRNNALMTKVQSRMEVIRSVLVNTERLSHYSE